jgi:hypothetical protein
MTRPPQLRAQTFDHLLSAQQGRCRDLDLHRFGGFEIDCQFKLCRLFHRKIGGIFAAEDSIGIGREPEICSTLAGTVAQESASLTVLAPSEHRRQLCLELANVVAASHTHHQLGVQKWCQSARRFQ